MNNPNETFSDFLRKKSRGKPKIISDLSEKDRRDPNKKFVEEVWNRKYSQGRFSKLELSSLVVSEIHRVEKKYPNPLSIEQISDLLVNFRKLVPGGSVIYGMGSQKPVSISNCFVIDGPEDSYGGIFRADQEAAQIMKRRGGVGFDLSKLRSRGDRINNSAEYSTGVVSFANRYSNTTLEVSQEGRRGAALLSLDANHPDALDFARAKVNENAINGANISIKINNRTDGYHNGQMYAEIAKLMHKSAEPGLIFNDTVIEESPADCYADDGFKTIATNPCGELPLSAYSSCLLAHLNLMAYVDKPFTNEAEFMFDDFAKDVISAQRIMDDLVYIELEHIENILLKIKSDPESDEIKRVELNLWTKIHDKLLRSRRTGLGWFGLADVLASMNMRYDSDEAIEFAANIQFDMASSSYKSSIIMAKERGAFPAFSHQKEYDHVFINRILESLDDDADISKIYAKYGRRQISNLTLAPTGTLSIISGVSSGIEPVFELRYNRVVQMGSGKKTFLVYHPSFKTWYDNNVAKFEFGHKSIETLTDAEFEIIRKASPYYKSTTMEIDPFQKIRMQAAIQKYNDHAISVTHNVKANTTVLTILNMINLADELGCKGFTLYREGSRSPILSKIEDERPKVKSLELIDATKRPVFMAADVHITSINGEKHAVVIGMLNKATPYEVFAFKPTSDQIKMIKDAGVIDIQKVRSKEYNLRLLNSKSSRYNYVRKFNKNIDANTESYCRLISISLRHGVDMTYIYEQIVKPNTDINNSLKAISRTFKKYLNNKKLNRKKHQCPNCKGSLVFAESCVKCNSCGYSRC